MKIIVLFFLTLQLLWAVTLTPEEKEFLQKHPVIKVSNESDWPPFDYNENGEPKGYSIDYLKLLATKLGIEFHFVTDRWSELVKKVKAREIDVIHPLSINEDRMKYLNFLSPHIDSNYSIISRTEETQLRSLKDLKNKKVAVVEGWNSTRLLKKHYPEIIFVSYPSSKSKLEAVAYGEVDATIEDYFTANYIIQRHLLSNLKVAFKIKDPRFANNLYIAIRSDWNIFYSIMNKAMQTISEEDMIALNIKWIKVHPKAKSELVLNQQEEKYLEEKKKIIMCIDPNWMPYEKNLNGKHVGMSSDYFKIFKELIPTEIEFLPTNTWTQTLNFAKQRKCDIISLAVKTPLRSEYLNFTSSYLNLPLVIATNITKPFVSDVNDILNEKIAVIKGHAYVELLKIRYPNIQFVEVDSIDDGFKKVLNGEVYGYLDSLASVGYDIQRNYVGNIKIAGKLDIDLKIGVATRNDEPMLHSIFEKAVGLIQPDQHKEILNKWVSVKYDQTVNKDVIFQVALFILVIALFLAYRQYLLKRQNQLLQESNEEFEHLINSTLEALFIVENGRYIEANKEGIKLLGAKTKEDIINLTPYDIVDVKDHEIIKVNMEKNDGIPYEVTAVKLNGETFPVLIKGQNFTLKNKKVRVAAMMDLSDLKSKEKLLLEQTKMAALGEMLGNIAHQWRQPLSVISTAASGMKIQKSYGILDDKEFEEYNEAIMTNVDFLSKTIDDFKNFIKENKQANEFILSEHIQKNLSILSPVLKNNNIEVITTISDSLVIYNLENELTQAIVNIVSNAKDAFVERNVDQRLIFISAKKYHNRVVLSIKDNAGGIDDEVINHIFEPYFTTKHKSQGTGLGLFMTRQIIVESMNGSIDVSNESFEYKGDMYKGANFRLTL